MTAPILPERQIGADAGRLLADGLSESLTHFATWGVRLHRESRLPKAVRLLQKVCDDGVYPRGEADLIRASNALRAALDFHAISGVLQTQRSDPIAERLQRAASGTLDDQGPTEAHRAQSELRFGAELAAGALLPKVPPTDGSRSPDYVIELSGLHVGLEIKRPANADACINRLEDAVAQLAAFGCTYQALVLDLSDCIAPGTAIAHDASRLLAIETQSRAKFREITTACSDHIGHERRRDKFGRVLLFVSIAHTFTWFSAPRTVPVGLAMAYPEVFHSACSGLLVEFSRDLRKRILSGIEHYGARLRIREEA